MAICKAVFSGKCYSRTNPVAYIMKAAKLQGTFQFLKFSEPILVIFIMQKILVIVLLLSVTMQTLGIPLLDNVEENSLLTPLIRDKRQFEFDRPNRKSSFIPLNLLLTNLFNV
jgi:hypothetical protein